MSLEFPGIIDLSWYNQGSWGGGGGGWTGSSTTPLLSGPSAALREAEAAHDERVQAAFDASNAHSHLDRMPAAGQPGSHDGEAAQQAAALRQLPQVGVVLTEVGLPPLPTIIEQGARPPYVDVAELDEPPPLVAGANRLIAERTGGVDQAGIRAAGWQRQVSDEAGTNQASANLVNMEAFIREHGQPPLPPLSVETLGRFNGGSVSVPVRAEDTPQMAALRQLQMTVAAVGRGGRLTTEEQQAFVERWRGAAGEGLYHYEADGTRRPLTAEEFGALQREGSTLLELRGEWQPRMVEDLRRMLRDSEPERVTTQAPRMTDAERVAAGRREAAQQMGDFYRIQANAGISLVNSTLQMMSMQPGLRARTEDGQEVQIGGHAPQLPTLELQSEYFGGARGEVLQTAATLGAGLIAGGGAIPSRVQGLNLLEAVAPSVRTAGGVRQSAANVLDDATVQRLEQEFAEIGGDLNILRFNRGGQTAYIDRFDSIDVRGDVLPVEGATHPRSAMSSRAVLAHELGHRNYCGTTLPQGAWNDEFRASYWAARNVPNLTQEERVRLIQDAMTRAQEAGVTIHLNSFMREVLYGF